MVKAENGDDFSAGATEEGNIYFWHEKRLVENSNAGKRRQIQSNLDNLMYRNINENKIEMNEN